MFNQAFTKTLIIASISFSVPVFADMFPDTDEEDGVWRIGGQAGFLNQSNNQGHTILTSPTTTTSNLTDTSLLNANPDYNWAWGVNLGYIFPSLKYDIQGSYLQLQDSQDKNQSFTTSAPNRSFDQAAGTLFTTNNIDADFDYKFDTAEVTFGVYERYSPRLMTRIGYGFAYVNIEQNSSDNTVVNDITDNLLLVNSTSNLKNSFIGGGPKITLDGQYDFIENWYGSVGIVAGFGVSALFGKAEASYKQNDTVVVNSNNGGPALAGGTPNSHNSSDESDKVTFGFDGKLGLRYEQLVTEDMNFYLEGGYEAVSYPDALQETSFSNGSSGISNAAAGGGGGSGPVGGSSSTGTINFEDNYYNYGPYILFGLDFTDLM